MFPFAFTKSSSQVTKVTILVALLLWMGAHFLILTTAYEISEQAAFWDAFVFSILTFGSLFLLHASVPRLSKAGVLQGTVGLALVLTFLTVWVAPQILDQLVKESSYIIFLQSSTMIRSILCLVTLLGGGFSLIFYHQWAELVEAKAIEMDTQMMVKEAELQKLQSQLQPHFLFNSLNSINALILIEPDRARVMVQQLSDFLRATLVRSDEKWITLQQELDYLELYLSIEKVRFGHRLDIKIDADEHIKLWLIPPLLIQPLVENAIKFGLYGTTENVVIEMRTLRIENNLQIEISNPFDQDMLPPSGSGFGLSGLRRRLYLLYAQNDLLKTTITNNQFTVLLTLPEKL